MTKPLLRDVGESHKIRVRYEKVYDCECGESFYFKSDAQQHRKEQIEKAKHEQQT